MANLTRRVGTDIRATLLSFAPGESKFIPYNDIVDENGNVVEFGSKTIRDVWDSRYRTLKKTENIPGNFSFRSMKNPDGTIIFRKS